MTKVKICGLSSSQAVLAAVESGADYVGLVLAPSKRQVSLEQAQELAALASGSAKVVGVFMSPSWEEVAEAVAKIPLDLVQIHGTCPPEALDQLNLPLIRAIQVRAELKQEPSFLAADYLLFDAAVAGSGRTFDWSQLDSQRFKQPFFLAGGLHAGNVQAAIKRFQPYAVDVSSGVESQGQKDVNKIRAFIESVKK